MQEKKSVSFIQPNLFFFFFSLLRMDFGGVVLDSLKLLMATSTGDAKTLSIDQTVSPPMATVSF